MDRSSECSKQCSLVSSMHLMPSRSPHGVKSSRPPSRVPETYAGRPAGPQAALPPLARMSRSNGPCSFSTVGPRSTPGDIGLGDEPHCPGLRTYAESCPLTPPALSVDGARPKDISELALHAGRSVPGQSPTRGLSGPTWRAVRFEPSRHFGTSAAGVLLRFLDQGGRTSSDRKGADGCTRICSLLAVLVMSAVHGLREGRRAPASHRHDPTE
jgi:hypothetical protein